MRRCDWLESRRSTSTRGTSCGAGSNPPSGAVDQVLGDDRRLVVRTRDLLDHDAALAIELVGVDLRAPDEVGQQVERAADDLGAAGDVERDEIVGRVRVEDR